MARRAPFTNFNSNQSANAYEAYNDDEIDEVRSKVNVLKSLTLDMGEEIKSQNKLLSSMDNDFDSVWGRLSSSMTRVKKLASAGHNCLYLYLLAFALFVFFIIYIIIRFR